MRPSPQPRRVAREQGGDGRRTPAPRAFHETPFGGGSDAGRIRRGSEAMEACVRTDRRTRRRVTHDRPRVTGPPGDAQPPSAPSTAAVGGTRFPTARRLAPASVSAPQFEDDDSEGRRGPSLEGLSGFCCSSVFPCEPGARNPETTGSTRDPTDTDLVGTNLATDGCMTSTLGCGAGARASSARSLPAAAIRASRRCIEPCAVVCLLIQPHVSFRFPCPEGGHAPRRGGRGCL